MKILMFVGFLTISSNLFAQDEEGEAVTEAAEAVTEVADTAPSGSGGGLIAPWLKIGPSISLGLLQPYSAAVDVMLWRDWEISLVYGQFAKTFDNKTKIDVFMYTWEIRGKWFPFAEALFLGLNVGKRGIILDAERELKFKKLDQELTFVASGSIALDSYFITPNIGYQWLWDIGFHIGFDIGYQFVVSSKSNSSVEADDKLIETAAKLTTAYQEYKKDVDAATDKAASLNFPYITLLRLGWMF